MLEVPAHPIGEEDHHMFPLGSINATMVQRQGYH